MVNTLIANIEIVLPKAAVGAEKQAMLLGTFNKPDVKLPFCGDHIDLRLLGVTNGLSSVGKKIVGQINMLGSEPNTRTFVYHVECAGQWGCGKTRAIFDIAATDEHFLLYFECSHPDEERLDPTKDQNFVRLYQDIGTLVDKKETGTQFRVKAEERVHAEVMARLLHLRGLFIKNPQLTPSEHLLSQLNGGQKTIMQLVRKLIGIPSSTSQYMLSMIAEELRKKYLGTRRLVAAVDEANVGAAMYEGSFLSPSGYNRGLLTPLVRLLTNTVGLSVSTIYAGTKLLLMDPDSLQSNIGKSHHLDQRTDFEPSVGNEPKQFLEGLLNLHGCEEVWKDPEVPVGELCGRKRLMTTVIDKIVTRNTSGLDKPKILAAAIKDSIEVHHDRIRKRLIRMIENREG